MGSTEWGEKMNLAKRIEGGVLLGLVGKGEWGTRATFLEGKNWTEICLVWFGKGSQLLQGKWPGLRGDTGVGCSSITEEPRHQMPKCSSTFNTS